MKPELSSLMMFKEFESNLYSIYWYDSEQTILMVEVYARWTWTDAFTIVNHGNEILKQVTHDKYLICHLMSDATRLPSDNQLALASIRRLLLLDPSAEEIAFFVGQFKLLRRLINVTGDVYSLLGKTQKYHYTESVSQALSVIAQHKAQKFLSNE
jgi:hypothetical protein